MNKKSMNHKTFTLIASIMLILAIPSGWPYAYYQILRWVVSITGVINAFQAHEEGKMNWVWIMGGITILFNPIVPVYLDKGLWVILDMIAAFLMFTWLASVKENAPNKG